jgi:hypothetical protein
MLFKEIIAVSENHTGYIQREELLIVKVGGTYIYHLAFKC